MLRFINEKGFVYTMDYGGTDKRRTKKDLKRKRLARGYKRGGQFRTMEVNETQSDDDDSSSTSKGKKGTKGKKGKKK